MFPQAETMCLDKYFLEPDDESLKPFIVPEVDHVNWEQFGALDMDRMLQDVDKWRAGYSDHGPGPMPILIIEGFLVLNHSVLTEYFHKKYFLTIDKETCIERRKHRCYNPPDKPGYFEKVVWPMYLKNRKEMEAQTDIVYLDGTEDQDKVFLQIAADIKQLIDTHSS
ncbi:nicotinamide riboside kinase 1-like isoform X2 [Littorina saxatilis]